jgi:hypothetical protein
LAGQGCDDGVIPVVITHPVGQIGMPGDLRELITASFDAAAADAWSKFTVGEADKLVLHEAALKVLKVFPGRIPGKCALMSALYSLALENGG